MKIRSLLFITLLGLAPGLRAAQTDDTQKVTVTIPDAGPVTVRFPAAWKQETTTEASKARQTLHIKPANQSLELQITFLADLDGHFTARDDVDRAVTKVGQHYVDGSVEKRLDLTQIESDAGHGSYFVLTDADLVDKDTLKDGQYRKVTSGIFVVGKQAGIFTLLSNDTQSANYRQALAIISKGVSAQ